MRYNNRELNIVDAYFRLANYLSVGQLYLLDNPILKESLKWEHVKKKIVGHWGTVPGQNFIYAHLNRIIKNNDLNMIYISGPGHGGNAVVSNTYIEGTYTKYYPNVSEDEEGLKRLFKQFSFPGGIPSHAAPETPGSINEGGELGYSISHAYGAILDNPTLIACAVIGDGEAETGPLLSSLNSNKFINPERDGIVLPILHLNGYKISNPTVLSRISKKELSSLLYGFGYKVYFVEGSDIMEMHKKMANTLDRVVNDIKKIWYDARVKKEVKRVFYPMVVLRTPKGWTGPKVYDDKKIEGTFRSHQVPFNLNTDDDLKLLERWLKSYRPEELFDDNGKIKDYIKEIVPNNTMGDNPNTNGGLLLKKLNVPSINKYAVKIKERGCIEKEDMRVLGSFVKDIIKNNPNNFRVFGPDETMSNRLSNVFEVDSKF